MYNTKIAKFHRLPFPEITKPPLPHTAAQFSTIRKKLIFTTLEQNKPTYKAKYVIYRQYIRQLYTILGSRI